MTMPNKFRLEIGSNRLASTASHRLVPELSRLATPVLRNRWEAALKSCPASTSSSPCAKTIGKSFFWGHDSFRPQARAAAPTAESMFLADM